MKERRGLVRSEDILGEIRQSNFLQLGMTSSQDETILVWNAMRNYLYIVLSVTYSPNGERWLSMWDVVDTTAPPKVIKSSTFEERRSRRSLCCPAANPMHRGYTEAASIYRTCSLVGWSKRQNSGSYDVISLTNRWTRVQSDFRVLFIGRKANSFSTSGQYCTCMGSNYCSTSISPI